MNASEGQSEGVRAAINLSMCARVRVSASRASRARVGASYSRCEKECEAERGSG